MTKPRLGGLSKSKFVAGLQCHRMLWWQVNEPDAEELIPDDGLKAIFANGHRVGARAQEEFPGGVLVDREKTSMDEAIAATARALCSDAPAVFEAGFRADGVLVFVDILAREGDGWVLVEVKSTNSLKDQHIPDAAVQLHVLRAAGVDVARVELMHLNPKHRHPDVNPLFVREDITAQANALLAGIPDEIRAQTAMLKGALPDIAPGDQCWAPYECAFMDRCNPAKPEHHVSELYRIGKKAAALEAEGITRIHDVPAATLKGVQARQRKAIVGRKVVVESSLAAVLAKFDAPVVHLDFETINPALPVWNGCAPYEQLPVQFSVHHHVGSGEPAHHFWLADGSDDQRAALAEALLDATAGANTVLAWHASFEAGRLEHLADAVPKKRKHLLALRDRLVDLLPIYREHVYHPAQRGSFSLKAVVPALVPELAYDDLEVGDGGSAAALLQRLLLDPENFGEGEKTTLRTALLAYCERDTLVMVRLLEKMRGMATGG